MTSSPDAVFDVGVVGAGPAGLAASTRAGSHGASVVLVDAGARPGGQYWRQPLDAGSDAGALSYLHHDLSTFRRLTDLLARQRALGTTVHLPGHHVWAVTRVDGLFEIHAVDRSAAVDRLRTVTARRLVLATGAYDRQVPFPGWDLPGVMTAGGAQALLKGHGVVAGRRVVVAGTGPFLLPVAAGLVRAGADVIGVHEAASPRAWLRHGPAVARNLPKLGEGLAYAAALARHRVPLATRSVLVAAHGSEQVEEVTVVGPDDRARRIACDTLAVGWGFTPQLELPLSLGCATRVAEDGSLVVRVDEDQRTTVDGVLVAGETCGVGGAALAVVEGDIAGATAVGVPPTDRRRRRRDAARRFASAMHQAHPVPTEWPSRLEPDTVVCRCEEVTADRLHRAVDGLGAADARSAKLLARTGMGWCQGRVCGYAVACLAATWSGTPPSPEMLAERPIAVPVTLGLLAAEHHRRQGTADRLADT
jgi:thioredoxin reductase